MGTRKAQMVSLADVARSVDIAVKAAATRHDLVVDKETLIDRWEIFGRRLQEMEDLNVAYRFAQDVTRAVKVPGVKLTPIVSKIDRDILVGFIERGRLPKLIER